MEVIISNYDANYRFKAVIMENYMEKTFETESYSELKKKLKIRVVRKPDFEEFERDLKNDFREIRKKVDRVIYCEDGDIEIFGHVLNKEEKKSIEDLKELYSKFWKEVFGEEPFQNKKGD